MRKRYGKAGQLVLDARRIGRRRASQPQAWTDHILSRHGRMRDYLDDIKATISNPHRVYDDTNYEHGLSFWRRGAGAVAERRRNPLAGRCD